MLMLASPKIATALDCATFESSLLCMSILYEILIECNTFAHETIHLSIEIYVHKYDM